MAAPVARRLPARLRTPDEPGPVGRVLSYLLLGLWSFIVLFPLAFVLVLTAAWLMPAPVRAAAR